MFGIMIAFAVICFFISFGMVYFLSFNIIEDEREIPKNKSIWYFSKCLLAIGGFGLEIYLIIETLQ